MSGPGRSALFLLSWAAQNLKGRSARTLLTVCGISLSVAILVTVLGFYRGYRASLEEEIRRMGYQVLITAKGCPIEAATLLLKGGNIPMYLDEAVFDEIAADPDIARVTRFLMQLLPGSGGEEDTVLLGVDDRFPSLKPWLRLQRGRWFTDPLADEAVVGWSMAEYRRLNLGDRIPMPAGRSLEIVGILDRSGGQDDGTLFVPVRVAQLIFDRKDRLTGIGVQMRNPERLDAFVDRIYDRPAIQVVTLSQVRGTILNLLAAARQLTVFIAAIAVIVSLVGVANSVLISVIERLPQLGVLRAMGGPRRQIFALIWTETAVICLAGAAGGIALAFALRGTADALLRRALPYAPPGPLALIEPDLAAGAVLAVLAAGLAAGLYPAVRAARVPPLESMRGRV